MSWIIKLGNEFEAKGHLQQGVICCGCHHLGKGLFRGAGEVSGCAVDFSVADCLLLNSTVETPRSHCFLLWGGIGAWVGGTQEAILEQEGARHPAGVQGECGDGCTPQCPGAPQEWICTSPCDVGTSSRCPRSCWGEEQCCGWAVPGGCCSHCPVLRAAEQGQLLIALSPTIVPPCQGLSQTTPCVYISLFSLPWEQVGSWWLLLWHLAGRLVIPRSGPFCGHMCGDRAWQEQAAHPHLAVRAWYSCLLCPTARQELPVVSVWSWVCASVSG